MITELDSRARQIFATLVETYLSTGEPVGSRTLASQLEKAGLASLSPASIRAVMAALEGSGLLSAPHTSAGRMPTDLGLRLFVDGLLQLGDLSAAERADIEGRCRTGGRSLPEALGAATALLSGLSASAALVAVPTFDRPLKHIEFVPLAGNRALVVLVTDDGQVENRVIELPLGVPAGVLVSASNFLASRLIGKTLAGAQELVAQELAARQHELDELTQKVITAGLGVWGGSTATGKQLIVKGQGQLLETVTALEDLEQLRSLFGALETMETIDRLLASTRSAQGVKVFIGAQSGLFDHSGCALVAAPLLGAGNAVIGAIGVIGPTRLNYARIVPLVDFTARTLAKVLGQT